MINDLQIDELIQPVINLYNQMELDLIIEIAKRFADYDEVSGSLEWQIKKLNELGGLNQSVIKIIVKYSNKSDAEIKTLLEKAGYFNVDLGVLNQAYDKGVISVNPIELMKSPTIAATIQNSYKELNGTFRMIQTKAIEATRKAYMDIINTSYLDVSSGIYDYQTAIRKAVQKMAARGIEGSTYRRGNTYVRYSIEGTVRRDTLTAVHQTANKTAFQLCNDIGCGYVEISKHLGARVHPTNPIANHAGWQGKVFKIEGSEESYPNLKLSTGYPDDIQGLGGVNCRHRMFPFFPGISIPNPIQYDERENERLYKLSQHQRKLERDIRYLKKKEAAAKAIKDNETLTAIHCKLKQKFNEINAFCKSNGLKRDYSRELVAEQI